LRRRNMSDLWRRELSRRDFLHRSAAVVTLSGVAAVLGACSNSPQRAGDELQLARPDSPVTLPIDVDNPPLEDGLEPKRGETLRIFNWEEYLWPKIVAEFEAKYDVKVEISNFSDMDDALATLRSGATYDVFFHRTDVIGRLVADKLLQPLNHSYIPNLGANVWPVYRNPFYDQGARYGVPYTIYTTGIMWRADRVEEDIAALSNPYEVFWNPRYKGRIHLLDDYREVISMVLLKNGITDLNTGNKTALQTVAEDLAALKDNISALDIDAFKDVPSGEAWIHHAWSGDAIAGQYYFPEGGDPAVLRYWFPPEGNGAVANDCIGVLRKAEHPVLAHLFINHLLDDDVAIRNFGWNGYQPPQIKLTPPLMVAQEYVPSQLQNAITLRDSFNRGFMEMELSQQTDGLWHQTWEEFEASV
jgi:spermidine/putrescine transport system substrate-binding protein